MEEIGLLDRILQEARTMDIKNFISIALLFYIPFHFSKKAETLFFHLLYSAFGVYMLLKMDDPRVIYDVKMLVGLGLLLPQLKFIVYYIGHIFRTLKMMTANTYYFFVTIYYKILRFFNWVKSSYISIKSFFNSFSSNSDKEKEESYKEQKEQKFHEEPKREQEQTYHYEAPKQEAKQETYGEFSRFYSESAYTVLGVSADDDYKTIKKAYRKLVREYHPDLNPENIELYTEITQHINNAWEKVEGWKK